MLCLEGYLEAREYAIQELDKTYNNTKMGITTKDVAYKELDFLRKTVRAQEKLEEDLDSPDFYERVNYPEIYLWINNVQNAISSLIIPDKLD